MSRRITSSNIAGLTQGTLSNLPEPGFYTDKVMGFLSVSVKRKTNCVTIGYILNSAGN